MKKRLPSLKPVVSFIKKTMGLIFIFLIGVIILYFFILPYYLEKQISSNLQWTVEGSHDLEVVDYKITIKPDLLTRSMAVIIEAEIKNNGEKTLELLRVSPVVTNYEEKRANTHYFYDDESRTKINGNKYLDMLPFEIGTIIPPKQKRPIQVWGGMLMNMPNSEDLLYESGLFKIDENGVPRYAWKYYWNALGPQLLRWGKGHTTLEVREAEESIVEWYRYWDNIPYKIEKRDFCKSDVLVKIDPNQIFDEEFEKFGYKGVLDPNDLLNSGDRLITNEEDGQQWSVGKFRPRLGFVMTFYDNKGNFIGFKEPLPFEKDIGYGGVVEKEVDENGYWLLGKNLPCISKIKSFSIYLETALP